MLPVLVVIVLEISPVVLTRELTIAIGKKKESLCESLNDHLCSKGSKHLPTWSVIFDKMPKEKNKKVNIPLAPKRFSG